jgi:hypothetical protein
MVERTGRATTRRASGVAGASPPPVASPRARARRVASPPPAAAASPRGASPRPARRAAAAAASPSPPPAASPKAAKAASPKAPKPAPKPAHAAPHAHYEFGGPLGAGAITLGLPGVCYALVRVCNPNGCLSLRDLPALPPAPPARAYASAAGFAAYLGWLALCVALHVILPGTRKEGTLLRDGTRLSYKLNGAGVCVCGARARRAHCAHRELRTLRCARTRALDASQGFCVARFALTRRAALPCRHARLPGRRRAGGGTHLCGGD